MLRSNTFNKGIVYEDIRKRSEMLIAKEKVISLNITFDAVLCFPCWQY